MNAATGVTPNNPNDTILKNNNQLISIKIYKICIYMIISILLFSLLILLFMNCFINVTKNNVVNICLYIYISML